MQSWAIVVAAGSGTRFGTPKQFARLGRGRVIDHAVATAMEACDGVVVVLSGDATWEAPPGVRTTTGGATRSDSVRAGLACLPHDVDVVVVHDAARPLASRRLFASVIAAIDGGADAAVPAVAVVDTLKRVEDGRVIETIAREGLFAVQTPQAFRRSKLVDAHAKGGVDTDDAALVEAIGGHVVVVEGERRNFKLTLVDDLELAQALVEGASA